MRTFHANWAFVVVGLNLAAGIWGLALAATKRAAPGAFWLAIPAGQVALVVQIVVGVAMINTVGSPPGIHMFYGFVVLIAAVLSYAVRGDKPRQALLVSAIVAVFIGAVSVRAMITA